MDIVELVNQFGLPIVVAGGLGYFIFFIWMIRNYSKVTPYVDILHFGGVAHMTFKMFFR